MNQLALPATDAQGNLEAFFAHIGTATEKNQYTHALHPYPAKFIPHIPREIIRAYSCQGDTVWDPMCGSGTTLVEAVLEGRQAIGGDLNPVAVLAAKAKTAPLSTIEGHQVLDLTDELESLAATGIYSQSSTIPEFLNRDHWFEPQVSQELATAKALINEMVRGNGKTLALCAFSAIIVAVSNQESETRWRAIPREVVPGDVLLRLSAQLRSSLIRVNQFASVATGSARVRLEDARTPELAAESVDLVVTSPPYANSHDYYLYNKLRLFWLGYEVKPVQMAEIGSRNRHSDRKEGVDTYLNAMESVMRQMYRSLRSGGRAVVVVADSVIRGEFFDMDIHMSERASASGFVKDAAFAFDHRRYNTTFQRGFGTKQSKVTHVLVFRKPQ